MRKEPKPNRGMPRSLLYALIPGGFLLLVVGMFLVGFWKQETGYEPDEALQDLRRRR